MAVLEIDAHHDLQTKTPQIQPPSPVGRRQMKMAREETAIDTLTLCWVTYLPHKGQPNFITSTIFLQTRISITHSPQYRSSETQTHAEPPHYLSLALMTGI